MKTCGWKDRRPSVVASLAADGVEAIKLKIKRPSKPWRVGRHGPYRLPKVVVPYLQWHVYVYLGILVEASAKIRDLTRSLSLENEAQQSWKQIRSCILQRRARPKG